MNGKRKVASRPAELRARTRDDATFPISSQRANLLEDYGARPADLRKRDLTKRQRVVIAANPAMVEMCADIRCAILEVPVRRMGVRLCT
jgi:hypothetical protein